MGRLTKAKIDLIVKYRKAGYTQGETAEKTGVHLKTVQKYDPLKRPGPAERAGSVKASPEQDLESRLRDLGDWIGIFQIALVDTNTDLKCPRCFHSRLGLDHDDDNLYVCKKCGYKLRSPRRTLD